MPVNIHKNENQIKFNFYDGRKFNFYIFFVHFSSVNLEYIHSRSKAFNYAAKERD